MNLSPNAIGMLKDFPDGSQLAIAKDPTGKILEFKIKCKAKDLQAQQLLDLNDLLK